MHDTLDLARPDDRHGPDGSDLLAPLRIERRRPGARWLVVIAAVAGLCGELLYRRATGGTTSVALVALAWIASIGPHGRWRPHGWLPIVTVAALAVWLPFRSSPWVDGLLIAMCLVVIAFGPSARRWEELRASRRFHWLDRLLEQLVTAVPTHDEQERARSAAARGPSVSLSGINPIGASCSLAFGVVLIALLRSGDAVFDSIFSTSVDLGWLGAAGPRVITTLMSLVAVGWLLLAAVGTRAAPPAAHGPIRTRSKDAALLLTTSAVVLGAFAMVQLLALAQGSRWVAERTGTTYASYAREGFFQLIAVAVLVVGAILLTRLLTGAERHRPTPTLCRLVEINAALVGLLVVVSVRRLDLYEEAFGASLLRTMATWGALVAGVLTVVVAVATSQSEWLRVRLAPTAVGVVVVALVGLAAYDPEHQVADHNISRFANGAELDLDYLARLSADAWIVVERRLPPTFVASRLDGNHDLCSDEPSSSRFELELRDQAIDDWWTDLCSAAPRG